MNVREANWPGGAEWGKVKDGYQLRKDDYFLGIAEAISQAATCPRRSVGVVVVKGNRIVGGGYNGAPSGDPHCKDIGCDISKGHCKRASHAERNAIETAARFGIPLEGTRLFVTLEPCGDCQRSAKQAGVIEIVYRDRYRI